MSDQYTTVTIRVPIPLFDQIKEQAAAEDRNISQYFRYHIGKKLDAAAAEAAQATDAAAEPATSDR